VPPSLSLAMVLPTTFVMPKTLAPLALASLNAAKVSAVSPDWLITNTKVSSGIIGFR